jgi:hypothetical protein
VQIPFPGSNCHHIRSSLQSHLWFLKTPEKYQWFSLVCSHYFYRKEHHNYKNSSFKNLLNTLRKKEEMSFYHQNKTICGWIQSLRNLKNSLSPHEFNTQILHYKCHKTKVNLENYIEFQLFFWLYWGLNSGLHAWKVTYCLRHTFNPFCSGYFGDRVSLFSGQPGPWTYHFCFPPQQWWQAYTTTPRFFLLRWGLRNVFCLGWSVMILLISASQVARITGISHQHLVQSSNF